MFTKVTDELNNPNMNPSMTAIVKCGHCNGDVCFEPTAQLTQNFMGELLQVTSPAYYCSTCHSYTLVDDQLDTIRLLTADEYRKHQGLLTGIELQNLRTCKQLSRQELATKLHVSPKQIGRWETWEVQTPKEDLKLRAELTGADQAIVKDFPSIVFRRVCHTVYTTCCSELNVKLTPANNEIALAA
jgi:DNA-binding transcriptional regulator YiaG